MNTTLISFVPKNSVIPTGVRPSVLGWSNEVEEPAVRLQRQTACTIGKSVVLVAAIGFMFLWTPGLAVAQTTPTSKSDPQKQMDALTTSLANGSVASIDILHMPDRMETRASVTPEKLEKWSDYRSTISKVSEWEGRGELVEAMKSTKVAPDSRMPDMRSAIVFNDAHGNWIGLLYFGRYFGRYIGQFGGAEGSIGNTPVKFNGDLATWLKHMIPSSLQ
jgi:hypothetical protein